MYHDEKVIDGILCWRSTPDGEWTQFTPQCLTEKFLAVKQAYEESHRGWMDADKALEDIRSQLHNLYEMLDEKRS